jgi:hypothetical protein
LASAASGSLPATSEPRSWLADVDDSARQLKAYKRLTSERSGYAGRMIAEHFAHGVSVSRLVQAAQLH